MIIVYLQYSQLYLNKLVFYAAYEGRTEEVVRLLGRGANPYWQNEHVYGWTALHWACRFNRHQMLTVLVNNHGNINIKDRYKDTPLHIACREGSFECVPLLVGAGCDSG